ncbi:MAG TPA: carboxymuconolactone decarboxylase family protein [Dehalococcoidia bacterium]|nr:carboxymuconolactone decarboxylase family protein [Dehalococcoidia bacterium]
MKPRLDYHVAQGAYQVMAGLEQYVRNSGLEHPLLELVKTRASQINGCAYCIDMHTKDARAAGESEQRLYALPAWRETPFFTPRERAALAFTESVTLLARDHVPSEDYEAVAAQFEPDEVAALLALIVAINAWNTIGVATRAWRPGSYEP